MNCLNCGDYIDIECKSILAERQLRFCCLLCEVDYKIPDIDESKIYEVSNVVVEVI